jgi:excinuclease ABC subunit A
MASDKIHIEGAREHNLRGVTVDIPRDRLTVITGLSGSGKSSLAFDTLYAEGQRRYVESLSAYARQFLDRLQKPDVDRIDGLSPAIAIEQRTAGSNPRSTVATTTEIHDYLRLLFSAIGTAHCPACGREVSRLSAEQMVERLLALPVRTRVVLLAPLGADTPPPAEGGKRGKRKSDDARGQALLDAVRRRGFVRVRIDGRMCEVDDLTATEVAGAEQIEAVVDRLVMAEGLRPRLADSVETALKHGEGVLRVLLPGGEGTAERDEVWSERNRCNECGSTFEPLTARHFSFNSPAGACGRCGGLGTLLEFDEALIVPDRSVSLDDGAIQAWRRGGRRLIIYYKQRLRGLAKHVGFDLATPYAELDARTRRILMQGAGDEEMEFGSWRGGVHRRKQQVFEGVIPNLKRRYETTESDGARAALRRYMSRQVCPVCKGDRFKPEVVACTVGGTSIVHLARMSVVEAEAFAGGLALTGLQEQLAGEVRGEIRRRLRFLIDVGLGYLTLDRESGTLSGGEAQRIRLATQIGSGLEGVLYVLDEPSIGLHQRDNERLIGLLKALRDRGNTVVVVEHDAQIIRAADHVIDLGPGAGRHGGQVIVSGPVEALLGNPESLTGAYLSGRLGLPRPEARKRPGREALVVHGAAENNLRDIDVSIPVGLFVCVTGVSGSGKSSLVDDILRRAVCRALHGARETPGKHRRLTGLEAIDKAIVIDQSPIGRTPRSNPGTYTEAFGPIRQLFAQTPAARVRGYGPGRFSLNTKGGRCEVCKGDGVLKVEMHFLPDVYVTCEQCGGQRYNRETLEIRYAGRTIADVLAMTVDEALDVFAGVPAVASRLRMLSEVGLGYVQIGQPATTLSGGEAQRIKLAGELARRSTGRTLYLLDEPTTGLHFADVERLLEVLLRLRDAGNTVLVVEHNLDVIRMADHIIDLGPEGGGAGGTVVVAGTPEEVAACPASHTGLYLRRELV